MDTFTASLTQEQRLVFYEGHQMILDGERLIAEVVHTISYHLPAEEKNGFLKLVGGICAQSQTIGKIKQTMEQINALKNYYDGKRTESDCQAPAKENEERGYGGTLEQTVLYGYAEDQGFF